MRHEAETKQHNNISYSVRNGLLDMMACLPLGAFMSHAYLSVS